jgi:subtilisin family serine protease
VERRPAWSSPFVPEALQTLEQVKPLEEITPEWAWGESDGSGVKVAVIDSGIDAAHPLVKSVEGYVSITEGPNGLLFDTAPHDDAYGHGTACAGLIRAAAPGCELYSVRVLGSTLSTRGPIFTAGLRWAIENGMHVCNLSLGTPKDFFGSLHDLADQAYFQNVMLVAAANNLPIPSYPSRYASVISVASHDVKDDPYLYYYNPEPPVEFGALGIDVRVAWLDGDLITATGNSFAAPHITGIVARILGKHPGLTQFQMKVILRALAANMRRD